MPREKWYSIQEAAEFLGISTVTLRRYIKSHKISAYRIASRYRFKKKALQEFLETCRLEPRKKAGSDVRKISKGNPRLVEQADDLAEEVLKVAPHQTRGLYVKAFAASRLGRYRDAEGYYLKILKSRPQESAAYLFLGLLYQEMKSLDRALEMWHKVVNINKSSELARVARYHITRALRAK